MSIIEFDSEDFLEYIDRNLEFCMKLDVSEDKKNTVIEHVKTQIVEYINTMTYKNNTFVVVDEIDFMLKLFEILDNQICEIIDLNVFLEKLQSFSKRHRNISKSLDKIVTKIEQQDIELNNKVDNDTFDKEVQSTIINFTLLFGFVGLMMSFINSFEVDGLCHNESFCDFEDDFMF